MKKYFPSFENSTYLENNQVCVVFIYMRFTYHVYYLFLGYSVFFENRFFVNINN